MMSSVYDGKQFAETDRNDILSYPFIDAIPNLFLVESLKKGDKSLHSFMIIAIT